MDKRRYIKYNHFRYLNKQIAENNTLSLIVNRHICCTNGKSSRINENLITHLGLIEVLFLKVKLKLIM